MNINLICMPTFLCKKSHPDFYFEFEENYFDVSYNPAEGNARMRQGNVIMMTQILAQTSLWHIPLEVTGSFAHDPRRILVQGMMIRGLLLGAFPYCWI